MNHLHLVIVTPARNESERIGKLSSSLAKIQSDFRITWILVNDSSSDDLEAALRKSSGRYPDFVIKVKTSGRIASGGAYQAWWAGVDFAKRKFPDLSHVMKLDADVELESDYFFQLKHQMFSDNIGILGGVLSNDNREQLIHVPGPVKMYSRDCLDAMSQLPLATGFDVMDEVLARKLGYRVEVNLDAHFRINRSIGASQGLLHGRKRNGMVCRWTGYYKPYFILHLIRYLFRKPFLIGSVAMAIGFLTAQKSPFARELRTEHANQQRILLGRILKNPIKQIQSLYSRKKSQL
jgi:dolichol-phosphate mannosyltransferase